MCPPIQKEEQVRLTGETTVRLAILRRLRLQTPERKRNEMVKADDMTQSIRDLPRAISADELADEGNADGVGSNEWLRKRENDANNFAEWMPIHGHAFRVIP